MTPPPAPDDVIDDVNKSEPSAPVGIYDHMDDSTGDTSPEVAVMHDWMIYHEGAQFGPITDQGVIDMLANGELDSFTLVWHEDLEDWTELGQLDEFQDFFQNATQIMPSPLDISDDVDIGTPPEDPVIEKESLEADLSMIDEGNSSYYKKALVILMFIGAFSYIVYASQDQILKLIKIEDIEAILSDDKNFTSNKETVIDSGLFTFLNGLDEKSQALMMWKKVKIDLYLRDSLTKKYLDESIRRRLSYGPLWALQGDYVKSNQLMDDAILYYKNGIGQKNEIKDDGLLKASTYMIHLGDIFYDRENYDSSLVFYKKALTEVLARDQKKYVYYRIGLIEYNNGQLWPAKDRFSRAVNLDPNYKEARDMYNKIMERLGQSPKRKIATKPLNKPKHVVVPVKKMETPIENAIENNPEKMNLINQNFRTFRKGPREKSKPTDTFDDSLPDSPLTTDKDYENSQKKKKNKYDFKEKELEKQKGLDSKELNKMFKE